ncbi:MAG: YncE family protein [Acidiphilium sp.]|nr:YncE family protein [Acidiphilium sp.]MDD4936390.1 YncE family protein [Acidiphilium sp.]
MIRSLLLACTAFGLAATSVSVTIAAPPFAVAKTIALGNPTKWDFVVFDPVMDRAYFSHDTEVSVLDGRTGAVLGELKGIDGSHGIAPIPALNRVIADSGRNHMAYVYNAHSFKKIAAISVVIDADGMTYDPVSDEVFVFGGDAKATSVIDPKTDKVVATIPLGGSPEEAVPDGRGHVFVNISDRAEIARIDTRTNKISAMWNVPMCPDIHGLAIDPQTHRLFASCKGNGTMIVVDAHDGKVLDELPIGLGTDGAGFDPTTHLAFSSNKDGTLSVIKENGPDKFTDLGNVRTALGAKNMAVDPKTGRVFLVTADVKSELKGKPNEAPDFKFIPGTLHAIFLDPAP